MSTKYLTQNQQRLAQEILQKRGLAANHKKSIPRLLKSSTAPLSFAQLRLWYHEQLHPNSALYNTPVVIGLYGLLDPVLLEYSFDRIIERHEALRTIFYSVDGVPEQQVVPAKPERIIIDDISALPEDERELTAARLSEASIREPFDLESGPVFRCKLIKLSDNHWWLLVLCHHIVFDGWSSALLMREIAALYESGLIGKEADLPTLAIRYSDYASWQNSDEMAARMETQLSYWVKKMDCAPQLTTIPTDKTRPAVQTFSGKTHTFKIPRELFAGFQKLARSNGVTEFVVAAAVLKVLLYRITNQQDIVICTGIANRNQKELEDLIGCFINVLLLRTDNSGNPKFFEFIRRVGDTFTDAFANQDLPFERLVSALSPERDLSYNPLAQIMVVYHNTQISIPAIPGLRFERVMPEKAIAQYDLLLHLRPNGQDLVGMLEYNIDLFNDDTMQRFCDQFLHVLEAVIEHPETPIDTIPILPNNQRLELLSYNITDKEFPTNFCVHELIEFRAESQPQASAIQTLNGSISYSELNEEANRIAGRLKQLGVKRGNIVGIALESSPNIVLTLLAVIKCGSAYLPIDPNYPLDRIQFMITDANVKFVITENELGTNFRTLKSIILFDLERESEAIKQQSSTNVKADVTPDDLLYVIFTSGSTGMPKGAMLNHRGRVNNFYDINTRFDVGPGDRVLTVSPLSFDMSAYDVLGTLMGGATVVLSESNSVSNPDEWGNLIEQFKVTIWHSVPSLMQHLLDRFTSGQIYRACSLRLVLLGGDWIPLAMPQLVRRYASKSVKIVSLGGATEVSMDSVVFEIEQFDTRWISIPYGLPMANQKAYILDGQFQLQPIGVPGELYIGGIGIGWGYYDRPSLTAERFVPNPFSKVDGDKIYRTGDYARWNSSGVIELLGRVDHQVKINGVRIELGEIDNTLMNNPGVINCVSIAVKSGADGLAQKLVSFIVAEELKFNWENVQAELFEQLPSYMVPKQHILIDSIPLSSNGKVLRRALPRIDEFPQSKRINITPETVLEKIIHMIWGAVLGTVEFSTSDDFFELGGTSLQAVQVINRIPQKLTLLEFIRNCTVRKQAALISSSNRSIESRIFRFPTSRVTNITLLCVPYAGGSAISFRNLAQALPVEIATVVVCMNPRTGNESRLYTLQDIAAECLQELSPKDLESIAVYGHCAGIYLAIELSRQLCAIGHPPTAFFLAGSMPPGIPSSFGMPRKTELEIEKFVSTLGGTEESVNPADFKILVRDFQRDNLLIGEYMQNSEPSLISPIDVPLFVLNADEDPVTKGHLAYQHVWSKIANTVEFRSLNCGHYFVSDSAADVAEIVARDVLQR